MAPKPFIDTNVLIYGYSRNDPRHAIASGLVLEGGVVSVQVLSEFVDVARRKLKLDWDQITAILDDLRKHLDPPMAVTATIQANAIELCRRHGFRIYDGLVVAAAKAAGCGILLTEDLTHGQTIDGVTIVDPFRPIASC